MSATERVIKILLAIANTLFLGGFVTLMTMFDGTFGSKPTLPSGWIVFPILILWIGFGWSWALKKPGETLVSKIDQSSDTTIYDA